MLLICVFPRRWQRQASLYLRKCSIGGKVRTRKRYLFLLGSENKSVTTNKKSIQHLLVPGTTVNLPRMRLRQMSGHPDFQKEIRCSASKIHQRSSEENVILLVEHFDDFSVDRSNFLYKCLLSIERFHLAQWNVPRLAALSPEGGGSATPEVLRLRTNERFRAVKYHLPVSRNISVNKSALSRESRDISVPAASPISGFDGPRFE